MSWLSVGRLHWRGYRWTGRQRPEASPDWRTILRFLLWVTIAVAVGAYTWILWSESLHRR